jgi:hypothetical protein
MSNFDVDTVPRFAFLIQEPAHLGWTAPRIYIYTVLQNRLGDGVPSPVRTVRLTGWAVFLASQEYGNLDSGCWRVAVTRCVEW